MNADAITPLRHRRIEDVNVSARKLSASTNMAPLRVASSMAVSRQARAIGSSLRPSRQRARSAPTISNARLSRRKASILGQHALRGDQPERPESEDFFVHRGSVPEASAIGTDHGGLSQPHR